MDQFVAFHQLYQPLQPSLPLSENDAVYTEYAPHPLLRNTIYCYWELRTNKPLPQAFPYTVAADACIDIVFDRNDSTQSFVTGFSRTFIEFSLEKQFHYFGVRFFPAVFAALYHEDASLLTNQTTEASNVMRDTTRLIDTFDSKISAKSIIRKLDQHFRRLSMNPKGAMDYRVSHALHLILQSQGSLTIEEDLKTGIVSGRHLRRLFQFYVGDSIKALSRIIRFQNMLGKLSKRHIKDEKGFLDAGYYDQAHFIKDFRTLSGRTPKNL